MLHERQTNTCGTVRKNRRNNLNLSGQQERDSSRYMHLDDSLALRWRDKKDVYMLSTIHTPDYVGIERPTTSHSVAWKPGGIVDYDAYVGTVDQTVV